MKLNIPFHDSQDDIKRKHARVPGKVYVGSIREGIIKVVTHLVSKIINTHKKDNRRVDRGWVMLFAPKEVGKLTNPSQRDVHEREFERRPSHPALLSPINQQARQRLNSPVAALRSGIHCGLVGKRFGGREAEGSRAAAPRARRNGVRARRGGSAQAHGLALFHSWHTFAAAVTSTK